MKSSGRNDTTTSVRIQSKWNKSEGATHAHRTDTAWRQRIGPAEGRSDPHLIGTRQHLLSCRIDRRLFRGAPSLLRYPDFLLSHGIALPYLSGGVGSIPGHGQSGLLVETIS